MPKAFPCTMGWQPDYHTEAAIYAQHVLATERIACPNSRSARSTRTIIRGKTTRVVSSTGWARRTRSTSPPRSTTSHRPDGRQPNHPDQEFRSERHLQRRRAQGRRPGDPQGRRPRLEAGALPRQRRDLGAAVLKPAGFDNSTGMITAAHLKDATDPQWADYPDFKQRQDWMKKYLRMPNPATPATPTRIRYRQACATC